jgi:hypothetical protein
MLAKGSNIPERQRLAFVSITENMPIVYLHEEKRIAVPGTWGWYSRHGSGYRYASFILTDFCVDCSPRL